MPDSHHKAPHHHAQDILAFLVAKQGSGECCALVMVTDITGGTMRAPGAMMVVPGDGAVAGYVSNGCVDADIIFQARQSLIEGKAKTLLYGEGSPFKDIILPCGGSIRVLIMPDPDAEIIERAAHRLRGRQDVTLNLGLSGQLALSDDTSLPAHWIGDIFCITYHPKIRLRIVGRGAAVKALTGQAVELGFDAHVQSPDIEVSDMIGDVPFDHLINPQNPPECTDDPWTALVLLFHDHDWELEILRQALAHDAFYIGAMGSRTTHKQRIAALDAMGLDSVLIDRVRGPVGLIPSMRDANMLALSILAEIVSVAQKRERL